MLLLFEGEQGARQTQHFTEEMLSVGHLSWDLHSGDMQWSRGLYNLLGAELSSVRPCVSEFDRFIHPDDRHLLASAEQMLRQSVAIEREFRVVSLSGRLRWIALKAEPIAGNERDLARVIGICSDVTRRQEDVLLLQQNQRRLQAIARLSGVLCWVSKPDGSFIDFLNSSDKAYFAKLAACPDWTRLVHPEDLDGFSAAWRKAAEHCTKLSIEFRMPTEDGNSFPCWLLGAPSLDASGQIVEWSGILRRLDESSDWPADERKPLSGAQIRASRAILNWSVERLARQSGVRPGTIRRLEEFDGQSSNDRAELERLEKTLSISGVEFLFSRGGKPGLRPR